MPCYARHLCCNIFFHMWIISLSHSQSHDNPKLLRYNCIIFLFLEDCENVAVQVHRCNSKNKNEGSSCSYSSSTSSGCSESLSYVSRISQQVFVSGSGDNPANNAEDLVQYSNKKYQKSHDQMLKNKVASFFSSVSISKYNKSHNTKL